MSHCGSFWATLELLVSIAGKNDLNSHLFNEEFDDWLDNVSNKVNYHIAFSAKEDEEEKEKQLDIDYHLVECNITHPVVKSRLEMLMGSNIVRLTDRKYMLKLMLRIQQDHEMKQQLRIEERMACKSRVSNIAQQFRKWVRNWYTSLISFASSRNREQIISIKEELSRTKTMILNRLMPIEEAPDDIRQHSLFQLYLQCDSIQKQRKKESRKFTRLRKSLYRMLYPNVTNSEVDEEENDYLKKITVGTEADMVPLTDEEVSDYLREQEERKDMERGYILNQEDFDRLHYETDSVKSLRGAKSVEEMYAKAHAIVGLLYSYADEARYKQEDSNDVNEKFISKSKDTENLINNGAK